MTGGKTCYVLWMQLENSYLGPRASEDWIQRPEGTSSPWERRETTGLRERLRPTSFIVNLLPHLNHSGALSRLIVLFAPPCVEGRPKVVRPLHFATTIFAVLALFLPHLPPKLLFTAALPSRSHAGPHCHRDWVLSAKTCHLCALHSSCSKLNVTSCQHVGATHAVWTLQAGRRCSAAVARCQLKPYLTSPLSIQQEY